TCASAGSALAPDRRQGGLHMRVQVALLAVLIGGAAWAGAPKQEGVIDPKADAGLRRMGAYLGSLKTFKGDATTVDQHLTTGGQKVQELQQSRLTVQRPNAFRVDRVSPAGHGVLRDDGKQFSAYNKEKNVYATAPAPAKIDAAVDDFRDRLHVDAPGGDLIV